MKMVETSQYQIRTISDETFHGCKILSQYQGVKKVMLVLLFHLKKLVKFKHNVASFKTIATFWNI